MVNRSFESMFPDFDKFPSLKHKYGEVFWDKNKDLLVIDSQYTDEAEVVSFSIDAKDLAKYCLDKAIVERDFVKKSQIEEEIEQLSDNFEWKGDIIILDSDDWLKFKTRRIK